MADMQVDGRWKRMEKKKSVEKNGLSLKERMMMHK